jgi:cell division septal protein FtsQ
VWDNGPLGRKYVPRSLPDVRDNSKSYHNGNLRATRPQRQGFILRCSEKSRVAIRMKKKARVLFWIVIAIAVVAGFVYWQYYKLGKGLRTIKVGGVFLVEN